MLSDAWARLFVANTQPNQLINNIIRESIISVRRSDQNATMKRSLQTCPLNRLPRQRKRLNAPAAVLPVNGVGLL